MVDNLAACSSYSQSRMVLYGRRSPGRLYRSCTRHLSEFLPVTLIHPDVAVLAPSRAYLQSRNDENSTNHISFELNFAPEDWNLLRILNNTCRIVSLLKIKVYLFLVFLYVEFELNLKKTVIASMQRGSTFFHLGNFHFIFPDD